MDYVACHWLSLIYEAGKIILFKAGPVRMSVSSDINPYYSKMNFWTLYIYIYIYSEDDMIWYDMIWYDDMIRYDTIWYDMLYDMKYDMIWCDVMWYDVI